MRFSYLLLATLALAVHNPQVQAEPAAAESSITFDESGLPRSLDPHRAGDVVSSRHVGHVYETLLEYAPFGKPRLQPCLAAQMPTYDRATRTYAFKLRDDVYFADDECFPDGKGRKVTAADFVFSFKRLAALPDSGGFWVIEGQIAELDEFRNDAFKLVHEDKSDEWVLSKEWWKHIDKDVSGLKAVDDLTFTITLNQHYPQFLQAITLSYGAVVAREAAETLNLYTQPVGTGPYVLASRTEELLVYKRNPKYRDAKLSGVPADSALKPFEGRRLPLTDELRYEIVRESAESFNAFIQRRYPVIGLEKERFNEVIDAKAMREGLRGDSLLKKAWRDEGMHLLDYAEPTLHYIAFNMNDKTFGAPAGDKGRALRRAFAMCVDRIDYIEQHLNGRGTPADQMLPPGVLGHDKACALPSQTHDPEGGRKLLKDAGFDVKSDGEDWITSIAGKQVELTICFRSTADGTRDYGNWLMASARKVGISVKAELLTFSEFLKKQDEGGGQAYDAGWVMDYPDSQNMLQLLYGPYRPPGINSASYQSAEYDALYEQMAALSDEDPAECKRKLELVAKLHEQIETDTPWVFMEFRRILTVYWDGYATTPPNPFNYASRKYVYWTR